MATFIEYCKKGDLVNVQNYHDKLNKLDLEIIQNAFYWSCQNGHIEVVKYLCDICDIYDYSVDKTTKQITPIIMTNEELIKRVHNRTHKVKNIICKLAQTPDRVTKWFFDINTIKRLNDSFVMYSESKSIIELVNELEYYEKIDN